MPVSLLLACALALPSVADEVDDRYHFIAALAEKGLHEQVVREAERFLAQHGGHEKADLARYRLASSLFELGRLDEARAPFAELAGRAGFRFADEVAFRSGQCELEAGANDAALAAFTRVREGEADYLKTPATFLAGEAQFRAGRFAPAAELYRATLAAADGAAHARDARHALAWCAYREGEFATALEEVGRFAAAFADDERIGELTFLAGECLLELERPDEALAAYGRVEGGPFHAATLRGAGFAHAARGESAAAAARFGELLERYPESRYAAEATLHRGIQLFKTGDPAAAVAALRAPTAQESAELSFWRGRALAELDRHAEALKALEDGLRRSPEDELRARLAVARADALYDLGRTDEAARAYEAAGSDYARHAAAVARLNDGQPEEAERLAAPLADPVAESAYRIEATLTLAEARFAQGRHADAEEAFASVAEADGPPERRSRATARLGWCRYLLGDMDGARARFEEVARTWPDGADAEEARFLAARAAERLGAEDAASLFAAYLEEHPAGRFRDETDLRLARLEPGGEAERRLAGLLERGAEGELMLQAHHDLGERLSAREVWAEAADHYAALLSAAPEHELAPSARYGLGWCRYSLGEDAAALETLEQLGADERAGIELRRAGWELAVWAARRAGEPDRAARAWARFASLSTDEAARLRAARVAAATLRDAGRIDEAEALYATLLENTRDRGVAVGACVERCHLALERGDVDAAERELRAVQRHAPGDPALLEAWFFVGEARFDAGDDAGAAQAYQQAVATTDGELRPRALYKLGFTHLRQDACDPAAQAFETLVTEHAESELFGEALFLAGEAHFRAERDEQAIALLARLPEEAPRHQVLPKALFRLGVAQARLARWRAAAETLGRLAQAYADFENLTEAELWRGRALAGLDQRRAARAALERVIERDQGVLAARAHIELGRLSLAAGERDEALSKFLFVSVLFVHDEEVAEALFLAGEVLEDKGDRDAAVARYREAVAEHPDTPFGQRARTRLSELGG